MYLEPGTESRSRPGVFTQGAAYGHERVAITRHGKVAAVVIGIEDLEALEAFEMERDIADLQAAKAADDGGRVGLDELVDELDE